MADFDISFTKILKSLGFAPETSNETRSTKRTEALYNFAPQKDPYEISMAPEKTDKELQAHAQQNQRHKYLQAKQNPNYKVKSGDNLSKIAEKFGVEVATLRALNNLKSDNLSLNQTLKIPPTITVKNVRNLDDAAKALGVSSDFVKNIKRLEDSKKLPDNKFHNTPYIDDNGVETIGIGHANLKERERITHLSNQEVCTLFVKDMLKSEENLRVLLGKKQNGEEIYDSLPQSIKEALLDMTFNKGTDIVKNTDGLVWCLKNNKYEAAINKLTNNKSVKTGKEMSGLSKRRLFDISTACKMFKDNIPQSNINTAQAVYNRGVELLRQECKKDGLNFENQIVGYNADIQKFWGDKIKFQTK